MKKLVVYYSFEGNTRFIAESIAEAIDADLLELKPKDEMQTKGFMKFIWGGKQVFMKKAPELEFFDKNPQDYDVLFIGTPVWAWSYAPALNTFFSTVKLEGKKIALFCCFMHTQGRTFVNMKKILMQSNEVLGEAGFVEPLKRDREGNAKRAKDWANEMIKRM